MALLPQRRRVVRAAHHVVSRTVERTLLSTARQALPPIRAETLAFHRSVPVVDLVLGTPVFRREFVTQQRGGHADLPRLRAGGVDLVGLSVVTRHPDLRGTLSTPHLRALGFPVSRLRTDMALAGAIAGRVRGWERESGGRLRLVGSAAALDHVGDGAAVRAFLAVQGGHVLDGDAGNVAGLRAIGVRMLALAHVMDNQLVGSNTGRRRGGLTDHGREVVDACPRAGVAIDLAHMSSAGIRDAVPLIDRPFLLSHSGFLALASRRVRGRNYSAGTRNVATEDARLVADAGGVIGVALSTELLGGDGLDAAVRTFRWAVDTLGADHVAIGSDFDGGLRAPFDARAMPALTQGLLDAGMSRETVSAVLGGNALRVLRAAWTVD